MKTLFTYSTFRTFVMTFVIAISTLNLFAQMTHTVAVTDYQFTPKDLTITVGDKVIWTNTGMGHNVNGTKATFPNNPVSFGNAVGLGWTYEFTFTTPGTYNYHCNPHFAFGMTGSVIVNPMSTATQELAVKNEGIQLYPNPASQYIVLLVPANYEKVGSLRVYSITGALIDQKIVSASLESFRYDLNGYKNGVYFMEIISGLHKDVLKFIKQ